MTFSKRVGMEPATDLKKLVCSLTEEAGFVVATSRSSMLRQESLQDSVRCILTYVHEPSWNPRVTDEFAGSEWETHKNYQMEIRAFIGCDGTYGGTVEIHCSATDEAGNLYAPTLRNCKIPLADLPQWLPEIARQMREVVAAGSRGERGPWQFGKTCWEHLQF